MNIMYSHYASKNAWKGNIVIIIQLLITIVNTTLYLLYAS